MNTVSFRVATVTDVDQLADLRWRLQTDDAHNLDTDERNAFVGSFASLFSSDSLAGYRHWVADREGRLIATMSLNIVRKLPSPQRLTRRWGYSTNCYVLPEYRNQGIGGELLKRVRLWSQEQGLELIVVWPSE